jgi:hypothetical protein
MPNPHENRFLKFGLVFTSMSIAAGAYFAFDLGTKRFSGKNKEVLSRTPSNDLTAPRITPWSYDAGPNPNTPMGRELIDLTAEIPNFPHLSKEIMGEQKFRPAFGPMPWRMLQEPNSVKILFIGQDGTHIAEAAGRPATAGFGGRAQDLAKYFGVNYSAAFINAFAFTIKGQYGTFKTPMIRKRGATPELFFSSFVENTLWAISQDLDSPLVQWRNRLIDWIIRNNSESLRMIVLFGGAARDAMATYIESKENGRVGTSLDPTALSNIEVPELSIESSGGNNQVAVPLNQQGRDLYSEILGRRAKYTVPMDSAESESADLREAQKKLSENLSTYYSKMKFSRGGIGNSGVFHPAQIGGYDLDQKTEINGRRTISLKGLKVNSQLTLRHDVLMAQLPHPTALSTMNPATASERVGKALQILKPFVASGWKIEPDQGETNEFSRGQAYRYRRSDMGPEYYDFGAPASRMVNISTAVRLSPQIIVFGTRDKVPFDKKLIDEMLRAQPSSLPSTEELFTSRPRGERSRYVFDPGPGTKYARIMKENIPASLLKLDPVNRDYGHYRGTFQKPRVVIVADPDGYDDLITARALTGTRGQLIHGIMQDLGVSDQYLVLKTAPFSKDSKDESGRWTRILSETRTYRERLLGEVLKDSQPVVILADGPDATAEVNRILGRNAGVPIISIERRGLANSFGLDRAVAELTSIVPEFRGRRVNLRMVDLPRTHLSFYARIWEGTSGDRVITSNSAKYQGIAFAQVAPNWILKQSPKISRAEQSAITALRDKLRKAGLHVGRASLEAFVDGDEEASTLRNPGDLLYGTATDFEWRSIVGKILELEEVQS